VRIAIYTAIFGDYDELKEPRTQDIECEFICFSDGPPEISVNHMPTAATIKQPADLQLRRKYPHDFTMKEFLNYLG
jgi:3-mercaptopyruvate sulfurtransferase SseA